MEFVNEAVRMYRQGLRLIGTAVASGKCNEQVGNGENEIGGSGGSLEPPGPLPTHLHAVYMAYSECLAALQRAGGDQRPVLRQVSLGVRPPPRRGPGRGPRRARHGAGRPDVVHVRVARRGLELVGAVQRRLGLYPIVTLEKQLPNMIGNLV